MSAMLLKIEESCKKKFDYLFEDSLHVLYLYHGYTKTTATLFKLIEGQVVTDPAHLERNTQRSSLNPDRLAYPLPFITTQNN